MTCQHNGSAKNARDLLHCLQIYISSRLTPFEREARLRPVCVWHRPTNSNGLGILLEMSFHHAADIPSMLRISRLSSSQLMLAARSLMTLRAASFETFKNLWKRRTWRAGKYSTKRRILGGTNLQSAVKSIVPLSGKSRLSALISSQH